MSADQLPANFAPYHLVRLDLPAVQCAGKFYALQVALAQLDCFRKTLEGEWGVLTDGELIDDSTIERIAPAAPETDEAYLRKATLVPLPRKPAFHIVRKAA